MMWLLLAKVCWSKIIWQEMAPDLKRKVDAARAARQAREVAMKKQIDAQVNTSPSPFGTTFYWAFCFSYSGWLVLSSPTRFLCRRSSRDRVWANYPYHLDCECPIARSEETVAGRSFLGEVILITNDFFLWKKKKKNFGVPPSPFFFLSRDASHGVVLRLFWKKPSVERVHHCQKNNF